jgi:hypothetical protein
VLLPAGRKLNHPRKELGFEPAHAVFAHALVTDFLEFSQVVALVAQLSILITKAAVFVTFADTRVFVERHKAALAHF